MTKGIPYFPLECVLDDKFALIEAEFGLTGFAVIVKLYQRIYGRNGYYCEYNDEIALLFGRETGLSKNTVDEIVMAAIKRGIFDRQMFYEHQILTSKGIQERYFEATSRRKNVDIVNTFLLIPHTSCKHAANISKENVNISDENASIFQQRKEKKSKEKNSKENMGSADLPQSPVCEKKTKHKHGIFQHVLLTDDEFSKLNSDYGEKVTSDFIKQLDEYLENRKDKHYANHNLTIRTWIRKSGKSAKNELSSNAPSYDLDALMDHAMKKGL